MPRSLRALLVSLTIAGAAAATVDIPPPPGSTPREVTPEALAAAAAGKPAPAPTTGPATAPDAGSAPKPKSGDAPAGKLDGSVFTVEITSSDGEKTADELSFAGGKLSSQAYTDMQFGSAEYTTRAAGQGVGFRATMDSLRGAHATWEGTVTGTTIEGTLTISMKGVEKATFSGTKK